MDIKSIFTDEDAVSPVIGVILMVAITVILAAVIGTFVLGLGDQVQSTSPSASFSFDFTDNDATTADSLEIVHDGGDSIESDRLSFSVAGAQGTDTDGPDYDAEIQASNTWTDIGGSTTVAAGSSITLGGTEFNPDGASTNTLDGTADDDGDTSMDYLQLEGATVRVTWDSDSGDKTATLGKWEGPDA